MNDSFLKFHCVIWQPLVNQAGSIFSQPVECILVEGQPYETINYQLLNDKYTLRHNQNDVKLHFD